MAEQLEEKLEEQLELPLKECNKIESTLGQRKKKPKEKPFNAIRERYQQVADLAEYFTKRAIEILGKQGKTLSHDRQTEIFNKLQSHYDSKSERDLKKMYITVFNQYPIEASRLR